MGWRLALDQLRAAAEAHALGRWTLGLFSPPWFSTRSVAEHLRAHTGPADYASAHVATAATALEDFGFHGARLPKMQAASHSSLLRLMRSSDLHPLLERRLRGWLQPQEIDAWQARCLFLQRSLSLAVACAAKLPRACAHQCIRLWAGGWTTSRRMQEVRVLPCLFGCGPALDVQAHYVRCQPLWAAVASATGRQAERTVHRRLGF